MEPYRLHNGHFVYSCNEPEKYHFCHSYRFDYESTWESVSYVAEKAYDARDIVGLFFDGATIAVLNHYDVPVPVIALIGGALLGIVLIRKSHKEKRE